MSSEAKRNVYVGHRYVPIILGEWENTQSYEGLSIVTYQGTSYTSKKRVPVGINILNEEYWTVTGNYNAQVENYRKEVKDLQQSTREELDGFKEELNDIVLNVKSFGAKGDGVTDDTQAIKEAVQTENALLFFPKGTYIVNVPKREEGSKQWVPLFDCKIKGLKGEKGQSIIKLGEGNGDARLTTLTGYTTLFNFNNRPDEEIVIDRMVFDFNGQNNPTYHREDQQRSNGIPHGVRQSVVDVEYIGDFTFSNNIIIDNQGTNAVVYRANESNKKPPIINIHDNHFINVGEEFGFGLHDHSTLYVHEFDHNPSGKINNKPFAFIYNNKFEGHTGSSSNAYCAIELGMNAKVYNNSIENYFNGVLVFSRGKENIVDIYQNNFNEVGVPFFLWFSRLNSLFQNDLTYAYKKIGIKQNTVYNNPHTFSQRINYSNWNSLTDEGYYPNPVCMVRTYGDISRDIETLEIDDNNYKLDSNINYYSDSEFRYGINAIELRGDSTLRRPRLDNLYIRNNFFKNIPNGILRHGIFSGSDNVIIEGNTIEDCMVNNKNVASTNKALIWIGKGSTEINTGVKNVVVSNNKIYGGVGEGSRFLSVFNETNNVPIKPEITVNNNIGADKFDLYLYTTYLKSIIVDEKLFSLNSKSQNLLINLIRNSDYETDINYVATSHLIESNRYTQKTDTISNLIQGYLFNKGDIVLVDIVPTEPYAYMNTSDSGLNWVNIIRAGG